MGKVKDFKSDVLHEINMLKKHATKQELAKLNLGTFNYDHVNECIYGQMTGACYSKRAKKLMNLSCIRVMDLSGPFNSIRQVKISSKQFNVNGEYAKQTWESDGRNFNYMSALEGYIFTKDANISGIIDYMKGETDTLKL